MFPSGALRQTKSCCCQDIDELRLMIFTREIVCLYVNVASRSFLQFELVFSAKIKTES